MKKLYNFIANWIDDNNRLVIGGEVIREGVECNADDLFDYLKNDEKALKKACDAMLKAFDDIDKLTDMFL